MYLRNVALSLNKKNKFHSIHETQLFLKKFNWRQAKKSTHVLMNAKIP